MILAVQRIKKVEKIGSREGAKDAFSISENLAFCQTFQKHTPGLSEKPSIGGPPNVAQCVPRASGNPKKQNRDFGTMPSKIETWQLAKISWHGAKSKCPTWHGAKKFWLGANCKWRSWLCARSAILFWPVSRSAMLNWHASINAILNWNSSKTIWRLWTHANSIWLPGHPAKTIWQTWASSQ